MTDQLDRLEKALADRYAIQEEIGAGGMATVYLAHDAKHDRKVAVKVLRPELAAVLGAERFLNEIKVTANLQHPHILPLHDSGEAYGPDKTGPFLYYVMPFVEGESLREKLKREKQLSIEESVAITKAVASALDYAHRRDVIHRDIKPENILLHDGQPVVADFGIALAVSAAGGTRITETGLSLGTPHYMSPEQATADRELTGKSDLYSLACVTYEMLVGDPPHTGSTAQAIVAKILTEEPRPVTAARRAVPAHMAAAVHKALEKLPADRFESADAFGRALSDPDAPSVKRSAAVVTGSSPNRWKPLALVASGVAAVAIAMALGNRGESGSAAGPVYLSIPLPAGQEISEQPAISRDGQIIAYTAGAVGEPPLLYVRRLDDPSAGAVSGSENARMPFFSPDGSQIAFFGGGALWKAAVTGGAPIRLADAPRGYGGTWGENDSIIFAREINSGLLKISADGGHDPHRLTTPDFAEHGYRHNYPHFLPGERAVLFHVSGNPSGTARLDLESGDWNLILRDQRASYAWSGHLLANDFRLGTLRGLRYSGGSGSLSRADVPVLDGYYYSPERGESWLAVSRTGTLVYVPGQPSARRLVWVDPDGSFRPQADEMAPFDKVALSPSGNRAVFLLDHADIVAMDLRRGTTTRIVTSSGETLFQPIWSADGERILFSSTRSGDFELYSIPARAGATAERLLERPSFQVPEDVWDDGTILFRERGSTTAADLWTLAPDGSVEPLRVTPYREAQAVISPDGKWVAYASNQSGRSEVYVQAYPGSAEPEAVSTEGGRAPQWSWDGTELYFQAGKSMMAAEISVGGRGLQIGEPLRLFTGEFRTHDFGRTYAVAPDGRFLMILREPRSIPTRLDVVLNWFDVLNEKVGRR